MLIRALARQLVLRLASLLWRLRRATIIETGLFDIQEPNEVRQTPREVVDALLGRVGAGSLEPGPASPASAYQADTVLGSISKSIDPATEFARCFSLLADLPNYALDRLSRYEANLWRQAGQILFVLDALDRRKPWDRARRSRLDGRLGLPVYDPKK